MATVAEGLARVTDGITSGRQQRKTLAIEIKNATRNRRSEVRSLLQRFNASRVSASREHAAELKQATRARRGEVRSLMQGLKTARDRATREYRREAIVVINGRRSEVKALMGQFRRVRVARRQRFQELAVAQRDKAAVFMRDLTNSVAALLDNFAKDGRDRAAAIRERLAAYASDRREAVAIWRGSRRQDVAQAAHRSAPESHPAQTESSAPQSPSAPAHDVAAAQAPDTAPRSGKRPFGGWGHKGSSDRHGKDDK
ncbi:hypothetical protein [Methylocystis sp.]|uniref:hypothetical protein n=1 Tax=Methylocystis sp. TaxID=1911079 RepID=UPI003DA59683